MHKIKLSSLLIPLIFHFLLAFPCSATELLYEYDANGNLIRGDGKYFEYNEANRLTRVRLNDQNGPVLAEYFYNYTGQRVKKVEEGKTTYYIGKHFETKVDSSGIDNVGYVFANTNRVRRKSGSGTNTYFHQDHLGSSNVITDQTGAEIKRMNYRPFGELREPETEPYLYTGKERDQFTENYYFEARDYNPFFKQFIQPDIFEANYYDPQSLNHMAYVRNNPMRFIDPNGYFFVEAIDTISNFVSQRVVDNGINLLSSTKVGNYLGDQTLKLMGADSIKNSSPEVQAAFYRSLSDGLDHSYSLTKKAAWTAMKATTSLFRGPDAVISDFYELTVMLLGETGYASDTTIDLLNAIGDIASLGQLAIDIKNINKTFHFSRNFYREFYRRLGHKNYAALLKAIRDNKIDKALKILKVEYDFEKNKK